MSFFARRDPLKWTLVALALLAVSPVPVRAQNVVLLRAGTGGRVQVAPGGKLAVPMVVDLSAAGGIGASGLTLGVNYNQNLLALDSLVGTSSFYSDFTGGFNGSQLRIFSVGSISTTTSWVTAYFTAAASTGATTISPAPTSLLDLANNNILPQSRRQDLAVCVASAGIWGDANGDNSVDIIDAQQIARSVVGLSVANATALSSQGDVTADGSVNIIDAQQIARFSVGFAAVARVNAAIFSPTVSSLALTNIYNADAGGYDPTVPANLGGVSAGRQLQLFSAALDATGANITSCATLAYTSSNTSVATVNGSGLVTALTPGTSTITVSSGSKTASVNIVVAAGGGGLNVWASAVSGNWSDATKWSLGRVPSATDSVIIGSSGTYTVTVDVPAVSKYVFVGAGAGNGAQTLNLAGQSVSPSTAMSINAGGALTVSGGTITTGTFVVNGTASFAGGIVNGVTALLGNVTLQNATTFNGPVTTGQTATLAISGDINCCNANATFAQGLINSGAVQLTSNGAVTSTITIPTGYQLANLPTGTISLVGPSGSRIFAGDVFNQGIVNVAGNVDLDVVGAFFSEAGSSLNVASGRTLFLNGSSSLTYDGGTAGSGGGLDINSGSVQLNAPFTWNGPTIVLNTATFTGAAGMTVPASQILNVTGGSVNVPVSVLGLVTSRSTTAYASGVDVQPGGIFRVVGDPTCCQGLVSVGTALTNAGTIQLTSANGSGNAATLLMSSGTLTNTGSIVSLAGTGGTRTLIGPVVNQAVLDLTSADLQIQSSFSNQGGSVNIPAGRTLTVAASAIFSFQSGSLTGAGTFNVAPNGGLVAGALLNINGLTLTATNASITGAGGLLISAGSSATLQGMSVSAPYTNKGLTVVRGTTQFSGALTLGQGGIFRLQGDPSCCAANVQISTSFTNDGTIELTSVNGAGNSASLAMNNSFTLTNSPTGVILPLVGTGGVRQLQATVLNQGLIDVSNGVDLAVLSPITNTTGTINIAAGRTLSTSSTLTQAGGAVSGAGTLDITGTLTLSSAFTPGVPLMTMTNGVVNGTATLTIPTTNTFTVQGSTVNTAFTNQGLTVVRLSTSFTGTFANAVGSIFRVQGDPTVGAATATVAASFTNGGAIELTSVNGSGNAATFALTTGTVVNAAGATITPLAGTGGTRTLNATLSNIGALNVNSGADLIVQKNILNTGTIVVGAGRTLTQAAGTTLTTSTGSLTGAGTYTGTSSALSIAAAFAPTIAAITLTSPTISGSGPFTVGSGTLLTVTSAGATAFTTPLNVTNGGLAIMQGLNTLGGGATVASGGTLRIQGNPTVGAANLTFPSSFANSGTVELTSATGAGSASQLTIGTGAFTNNSGGTFSILAGAGGTRTVVAPVTNNGVMNLTPGSTSALSITGSLTLGGSGVLNLDIAGSPLSSDNITVSGTTIMGGTLNLTATSVSSGQGFQVITGNVSGGFQALNSNYAPGFVVTVGSTNFALSAK